jgi:hypothetical protein
MIRVVSRIGIWEGFYGGSAMGLMKVVMMVCVTVWGWALRLMIMGICPHVCKASVSGVRL